MLTPGGGGAPHDPRRALLEALLRRQQAPSRMPPPLSQRSGGRAQDLLHRMRPLGETQELGRMRGRMMNRQPPKRLGTPDQPDFAEMLRELEGRMQQQRR